MDATGPVRAKSPVPWAVLVSLVLLAFGVLWPPFRPGPSEGSSIHRHFVVAVDAFALEYLLLWDRYLIQVGSALFAFLTCLAYRKQWSVPIKCALLMTAGTLILAPAFNGNYTYAVVLWPPLYADYDLSRIYLQLACIWGICTAGHLLRDSGADWVVAILLGVVGCLVASILDAGFDLIAGLDRFPSEAIARDPDLISMDNLPHVWSYLHRNHTAVCYGATFTVLIYGMILKTRSNSRE